MTLFQALFSFHGRLNRKGFWQAVGINFVFLFLIVNTVLKNSTFSWLSLLPLLLSFYSLAAVIVKRLHDRNRSSKALSMAVVPLLCYGVSLGTQGTMAFLLGTLMPVFIMTMLMMEWGIFAGNPEANAYGERGLSIKLK